MCGGDAAVCHIALTTCCGADWRVGEPTKDLDAHLTHGSLEYTRVHNPNGISIGSAVFAGLTVVAHGQTDPTDRPRYSDCRNRPPLNSSTTSH